MTALRAIDGRVEPNGPQPSAAKQPPREGFDHVLETLSLLCKQVDRARSPGDFLAGLPLEDGKLTLEQLPKAAARAGLNVEYQHVAAKDLAALPRPFLFLTKALHVWIVMDIDNGVAEVASAGSRVHHKSVPFERLLERYSGACGVVTVEEKDDARADDVAPLDKKHWFWREVFREKAVLAEVAFAAAVANFLAIFTSLFAMQVYDRVVPNLAFATLWALALGVSIAILLEVLLRYCRGHLMDAVGRRLDLRLSSRIFSHAINIRIENRPRSTGSLINQIREFDAVRDFFTSTTIGILSDIPFIIFFTMLVAIIGGPIVWVLIAAAPLVIVFGLLMQKPLGALSQRNMREGAVRNGLLLEAMAQAESVKSLNLENQFQYRWEQYCDILSKNSLAMRSLSNVLTFGVGGAHQTVSVLVILVGVYQISVGELTVGGLIACSILSSRAMAPLSFLAAIFGRWQNMKSALAGIDAIMSTPVERPAGRRFVHRSRLAGDFVVENASFSHNEEASPALNGVSFSIEKGAGVAILGGNGSGKSTLLRLLAGLYSPQTGRVLSDGADMRQIDPHDLRRSIAFLPQSPALFYGTLRDNLAAGLPHCDDETLLAALEFVAAEDLVRQHAQGLDRVINEGGAGVSGGQRQAIGLARIWLRDPSVVILDEPTAALDTNAEQKFVANMKDWAADRTLIVATHRRPLLALTNQTIVLHAGAIMSSGETNAVLRVVSPPQNHPSTAQSQAAAS